jgi:hypothetical protein
MAQQYKPGDYYVQDSGSVFQYDGTSWKPKGIVGTPGAAAAVKNGNKVDPPGRGVNPNVGQGEYQQQAGTSNAQPDNEKVKILKFENRPGGSVTPAESNILSYPSSRPVNSNSDYVTFKFFNYTPTFKAAGESQNGSSPYDAYNASVMIKNLDAAADLGPIILYMPEDIQTETSGRWSGAGFGPMITGLARAGAQIAAGQVPDATGMLQNIPPALDRLKYKALLEGINRSMGASVTENQLLTGSTGAIINPNVEMMYEAPDLRNFSLRFKMSPRDGGEAQKIRKICNTFRKASLPSIGDGTSEIPGTSPGFFLKVPKICQVSFMQGSSPHPYITQYKPCAISRVSVNYTPDGTYATYGDGSPVATELTLSFQELKLIYNEEVAFDGGGY